MYRISTHPGSSRRRSGASTAAALLYGRHTSNNPVKYVDPSGHVTQKPTDEGETSCISPLDCIYPEQWPDRTQRGRYILPPEPRPPLDIDPILNPAPSESGFNLYEKLENQNDFPPLPQYPEPYNPHNLPNVLHPERPIYTGSITPIMGLAIDVAGVVTDGSVVVSMYVPITLPYALELQAVVTGVETAYYLYRLEEGYGDAYIGVIQEQLDQRAIAPYVGFGYSLFGIVMDSIEISQGLGTEPY